MATEVSCGQCQGRLLVETLGVVVACPHCGTHLSIPAPAPEPAPAVVPPTPVPVPTPVPPVIAVSQPAPAVEQQAMIPQSAGAQTSPIPATPEDPSVFFGSADDFSANPGQIGWHSAPNLFLSSDAGQVSAQSETTIEQQPSMPVQPLFTSPLMERDDSATSAAALEQTVTFAEAPPSEAAATPVPAIQFDVSASQPLVFGTFASDTGSTDATTVMPPVPTPPTFEAAPAVFSAAPAAPVLGAAPATPVFGAAPAPAPAVFGAAPASVAPAAPVFGAAPTVTFGAAPATASSPVASAAPVAAAPASAAPLPTRTVAEDAAEFAENEIAARLKFLTILLIVVGSYASAVTIVLVYMLIFGRISALESLPDMRPPTNKNGDISWQFNPASNNLPSGHVLSLGDSQRFGSVRVTPVRVTRGPLKFEHYTGQAGMARDPSEPVLKLWLKFENVSRDQTFIPLDPWVLFTRRSIDMGRIIQANGFVSLEANRKDPKATRYFFFDMPIHSEFRIVGQNLNRELSPGEAVETFIPSEEDARSLTGSLVWRFQFRKGYNRQSERGVTTLVDVRFNSSDIKDERS